MRQIIHTNLEREIQHKTINFLITKGKKRKATKILKESLKLVNKNLNQDNNLSYILTKAVMNVTPDIEVKTKRIGATVYQIPKPINQNRKLNYGILNLIEASKNRSEKTMILRLSSEITDAFNNKGEAVKKKETVHKLAEASKAFAHFSF